MTDTVSMEANQTHSPERRTGQIDAVLFGSLIDLLKKSIEQKNELSRVAGPRGLEMYVEASGRMLGIAQSCALVSGIDVQQIISRVENGSVRAA